VRHELLTATEVADRLRVSRSTISRWLRDGVLVGVKIGGVLRFPSDEVDQLLAHEPEEQSA